MGALDKFEKDSNYVINALPKLGNRIRIAVIRFQTYARTETVLELQDRVKGLTQWANLRAKYAVCVGFTDAVEFNWVGDEPQYVKNVENWWKLVGTGKHEEAFEYCTNNVPSFIIDAWEDVVTNALEIWKPEEERVVSGVASDPN